ncbi:monosaccharide ABC transporter ATP-binding protein, CUT2 family [Arboricoccus pini]|uniref:Monosaccharide ABC transporter ATP-binding protein, CUT2 family n=1 Tax=Arboricoccus pini TaxID=1963835 RepID=A0A212PW43_9PROT|nr:sugar ABC transporter ATP-binding protein [Arboricoccus pini]SNB51085.1 monosaccharide ABC transporter ATP-binding protein, CUT2 family [Arboricoccus pini]
MADELQAELGVPTLEMRGISKTFPGVKALNGVELKAWRGQVLSLMGENGAGKSTLMKILSGAYQADAGGEILIDGQRIHIDGPISAKAHGIAIIYQELSLAPNLTVAENIFMGRELSKSLFVDRAGMIEACRDVLKRLGTTFGPETPVSVLSIAERQLVEIARAVQSGAKIIVMDEPTTALSSRETEGLFAIIRQLRQDGIAIIYISHRMDEIYELSDRVSVLRDGSYVGTLEKGEIDAPTLVRMMVGRELSSFYTKDHDPDGTRGPVVLEVEGITDGGRRVHPSSFKLHAGEVLGLAGLVGSGRTELARLIYGVDQRAGGKIVLDGKPAPMSDPKASLDAGLAYLTEDRKGQGLFLDMSVRDNVNLGVIDRDAHGPGFLNLTSARKRAIQAILGLRIRVASAAVNVGALSGGNQQKVLLSRWLETNPKVLILDEPTRGVDIGAKSEIYKIIDDLAKRGLGVLVISSELPEIIGICDRVLVMREGRIEGEVGGATGRAITQENIMAFATGIAA